MHLLDTDGDAGIEVSSVDLWQEWYGRAREQEVGNRQVVVVGALVLEMVNLSRSSRDKQIED